jgi:hypothetical protein
LLFGFSPADPRSVDYAPASSSSPHGNGHAPEDGRKSLAQFDAAFAVVYAVDSGGEVLRSTPVLWLAFAVGTFAYALARYIAFVLGQAKKKHGVRISRKIRPSLTGPTSPLPPPDGSD